MSLFYPNIYQKNILSIDYKKLKEKGIKLLIYDLDNTIISYETNIYGSNKLGLTSCLIDKISDVEGNYTKFKRKIEKRIIKSLYKKYNFERGKYYD